jgi:hypothetical protein
MAQKQKTRWSYAEDRRLIQLAASSNSLEAIADEMNRSPERIAQMVKTGGLGAGDGGGYQHEAQIADLRAKAKAPRKSRHRAGRGDGFLPGTKPHMAPCGPVPSPISQAKKAAARGWGQRRPFDSTRTLTFRKKVTADRDRSRLRRA